MSTSIPETPAWSRVDQLLPLLFFFSGFPALIYQLTWQRALFGIFGVNIESVTIVVAAFMLGLGLGSMAGGYLSQRRGLALLLLLAAIELATGVFGLISLPVFRAAGAAFLTLSLPATAALTLALVLLPTLLMGATLPLLVGYLAQRRGNVGVAVGQLYYVNTLGAGVACVFATFALFPFVGMQGSVLVAALINFCVAAGAWLAHRQSRASAPLAQPEPVLPVVAALTRPRLAFAPVLALAALGGFVALSYELFFFRVASQLSAGAAPAISLSLAAYLLGLASGSRVAGDYCLAGYTRRTLCHGAATLVLANLLGFLFLPLVANAGVFGEGGRIAVALLLMFLLARLWGILLPMLADLGIAPDEKAGLRTGQIYLANIVGSTLGGVLTGFVLMDWLTLVQLSVALLVAGVLCALLVVLAFPLSLRWRGALCSLAALLCLLSWPVAQRLNSLTLEKLQSHGGPMPSQAFVLSDESRSGIITVDAKGVIYGNGAYDGHFNTSLLDDSNGIVRPYALSLYHPAPRQVLMIGLSSGSWAQVIASNPEVTHLTVVEINPGYTKLIAQRPEVASLLSNPKVTLVTDDGRRWLRRHPQQRFDAIIMNTTFYYRANAADLLSTNILQMLQQHLNPNGTLFYNSTNSSRVQRTACQAFPYGMRLSNHMLVSNAPIQLDFQRWQRVLLHTRIDGQPVLDLTRAADQKVLKGLMGLEFNQQLPFYGPQFFESCSAIQARTQGLDLITDDNMGSEWRYYLGFE